MKSIFLTITVLLIAVFVHGQNSNAQNLSERIAQRMKDSLSLTQSQKTQVYNINMDLHNRKAALRGLNSNVDTLTIKVQAIEKTRDSLYRRVIGEEKYMLYLARKRSLVNNN